MQKKPKILYQSPNHGLYGLSPHVRLSYTSNFGIARVVDMVYREIFWGTQILLLSLICIPILSSKPLQLIMANSSDEEADSRTALVGAPRTRSNPRSTSRSTSHDSARPAKRQRRNRNKDSDLADFVPKGVAFSATSLPVDDPDNTSSSGSSSSSEDSDSDADPTTVANPHAGNTAPAISWNQGRKAAVRTTLGKRSAPTNDKPTQFEAVNDKYWRSRSASVSANGEDKPTPTANDQSQNDDELEDGEIDSKSDTDDSDSLGSEADDSILLNIGDKMGMDGANDYDPATLAHQHGSNANLNGSSTQTGPGSKEEAFRLFSLKYPNAPIALVDLSQTDLEIIAKYVYFDRNIHDLDLKLPISCIECQREGHMADVCPAKEVCSMLHSITLFSSH